MQSNSPIVLIYQAQMNQWLHFLNPVQVFEIYRWQEILPTLALIEAQVEQGLYAAGFLSYEAAPAFDSALQVQAHSDFPLLWFGLYLKLETLSSRDLADWRQSPDYCCGTWQPNLTQAEFDQAISQIKHYIAQGDTFQVNYSFRLTADFQGNPRALFLDLIQSQSGNYAAFVDTGRYAICSASPELFFTWDSSQLTTRPMKGTVARGLTLEDDRQQAEWLQRSEKNRAENLMIVDMIRNDLGRIAQMGTVQVPRLFEVERYPTLWQMTSTVTAQTQTPWSQIWTGLFPCASITGAPKPRTSEIITELETTPRRIYTGSIAYLSPDRQSQANVAIRTVLIDRQKQQAEYGIGSGIVWDSDTTQEYEECLLKAEILVHQRPEFSLLETLRWSPDEGYFLLDYHRQRLQAAAEYFAVPLDWTDLERDLAQLAQTLSSQTHKVRLLVDHQGQWQLETTPLNLVACTTPMRVRLAPTPIDPQNPFLYHKTTHRQVYREAQNACSDCEDVLLWNPDREVTESCIANLVIRVGDQWLTPPVRCGLLPGTYRAWLLEQHKIQEQVISVDQLKQAPEFYLINSVRGWQTAVLIQD